MGRICRRFVIRLMAGVTLGRNIGIVIYIVAPAAIRDRMSIGQLEKGIVDCELCRFPSGMGGMAFQTIRGQHGSQMAGIRRRFKIHPVAGVAFGRNIGIVCRIMAAVAVNLCMSLGQGEKGIMHFERRGFPTRIGIMAFDAIGWELRCNMVRIHGCHVIGLVAGITVCRDICIVTPGMAAVAFRYGMSAGKREKQVGKPGSRPGKGIHGMAFGAVCGDIPLHMVRIGGRGIIIHMAIDAFDPEGLKPQLMHRRVAILAISHDMRTDQRETAQHVNFCNIPDKPGIGCMAPGTIEPDRLVMHIRMALKTFRPCLRKYQGWMA